MIDTATWENFFLGYGRFQSYCSLALTLKNEGAKEDALGTLERMFEMIPEEEVKNQYPRLYEGIKGAEVDINKIDY